MRPLPLRAGLFQGNPTEQDADAENKISAIVWRWLRVIFTAQGTLVLSLFSSLAVAATLAQKQPHWLGARDMIEVQR